jgi:hypothetical protein
MDVAYYQKHPIEILVPIAIALACGMVLFMWSKLKDPLKTKLELFGSYLLLIFFVSTGILYYHFTNESNNFAKQLGHESFIPKSQIIEFSILYPIMIITGIFVVRKVHQKLSRLTSR